MQSQLKIILVFQQASLHSFVGLCGAIQMLDLMFSPGREALWMLICIVSKGDGPALLHLRNLLLIIWIVTPGTCPMAWGWSFFALKATFCYLY